MVPRHSLFAVGGKALLRLAKRAWESEVGGRGP